MSNRLDVVVLLGAARRRGGGRRRRKVCARVCVCVPLLPRRRGVCVWRNSADAICINEPPPDNGARSMNYVPRTRTKREIAFDSSLARPARPTLPPPCLGWPAHQRGGVVAAFRAAMAGKPSFLSRFGSGF